MVMVMIPFSFHIRRTSEMATVLRDGLSEVGRRLFPVRIHSLTAYNLGFLSNTQCSVFVPHTQIGVGFILTNRAVGIVGHVVRKRSVEIAIA